MKTLHKSLCLAAVLALAHVAHAVQIDGSITFTGNVTLYDGVPATTTTSLADADGVADWDSVGNSPNATVETADGDFAGLAGGPVVIVEPWSFVSGAVPSFWTAGAFTFDLTSSAINTQNSFFIFVSGSGVISAAGYDPTPGTWYFSTQGTANGEGEFSFSADSTANPETNTVVPDSGATLALLGLGLIGLAGAARRFKR